MIGMCHVVVEYVVDGCVLCGLGWVGLVDESGLIEGASLQVLTL